MNSVDVIHSFYIPAFKVKKDVVPGVNNHMWFQADIAGEYDVFCAEYCGDRHSYMLTKVKVLPQADYDGWYASTGAMFAAPADNKGGVVAAADNSARGQMLVRTKGCMACHSTDGSRLIGPSFKGIYGKNEVVIADGKERQLVVDEEYIIRSIRQPDIEKVKGYENMVMTQIELTDDEIAAIIDYMKTLK
jgi:cytochrome c oxidase subunit 2